VSVYHLQTRAKLSCKSAQVIDIQETLPIVKRGLHGAIDPYKAGYPSLDMLSDRAGCMQSGHIAHPMY